MAQGFARLLKPDDLSLIINVGDDETVYGAHVSADLDTVMYTLAGIQGPEGWGIEGDTFHVMDHLAAIGVDTSFLLGDRDLAHCLARTAALEGGLTLGAITATLAEGHGVETQLLPASDDPVRTRIQNDAGIWYSFQDYFVRRRQQDRVLRLEYAGSDRAAPGPGVLEAITHADAVVIAPSNPPLSIWPILAIPGIRQAIAGRDNVLAVSPFFGGVALKGPAAEVMDSLGLPVGTAGVLAAYEGLITDLVVDAEDEADIARFTTSPVRLHVTDTRITDVSASTVLAKELMAWAA